MKEQSILELQDVSFSYGCHPILKNITLRIGTGEAVGFVGPNGSGKTTLLKLILGLLKPQSGSIRIFGVDAHKLKQRYRIGHVSQQATHFNNDFPATVREVVTSGRVARRGLFRPLLRTDHALVDQVLEMVDLTGLENQPVGSLSGGQQQRVFIARALVGEPEILILDEPTVGIDVMAQASIYELLRSLSENKGMTLLIVSHEMEGLSSVINRQVCLDGHICSCDCHNFPTPRQQKKNCSKRLELQYAK